MNDWVVAFLSPDMFASTNQYRGRTGECCLDVAADRLGGNRHHVLARGVAGR